MSEALPSEDAEREDELLARLRGPYLESAGGKTEDLARLLCRVIAQLDAAPKVEPADKDGEDPPLVQALRLAHSLAGSGKSYGLPEISTRAREIEREIECRLRAEAPDDPSALLDPLHHTLELRAAILRIKDGSGN